MEAPAPKIEANLRRTFEATRIEGNGAADEDLKVWRTVGIGGQASGLMADVVIGCREVSMQPRSRESPK